MGDESLLLRLMEKLIIEQIVSPEINTPYISIFYYWIFFKIVDWFFRLPILFENYDFSFANKKERALIVLSLFS